MKAVDFQSIVHHFALFFHLDKFFVLYIFFHFGETKSRKEETYDEKNNDGFVA
jgi:hypothetical protein